MEAFREDDRLVAELRALRPVPRPDFAADLDRRAAAGFPPRAGAGPREALARLADRLGARRPRRLTLSLAGAALAAILVATVIVSQVERSNQNDTSAIQGTQIHPGRPGAGALLEGPVPDHLVAPTGEASAGAAANAAGGTASSAEYESESASPAASGTAHRDVERSAEIGLVAEPADVDEDAAAVYRAVHRARGIVLRSTTTEGRHAGAYFSLLIPAGALSDALDEISQIDRVRTRHEASLDITAPTVGLAERLREARARIDSLLGELAAAETEAQREVVEAELRRERRRAASLAARLTRLHRRAHLASVEVRIETGASGDSGAGGWSIDDALRDAGRVLAIAAGVALVGAAALVPLALLALLAWLGRRTWIRAARRRALG